MQYRRVGSEQKSLTPIPQFLLLILSLFVAMFLNASNAQSAPPTGAVSRDSVALGMLSNALVSLGGTVAWTQVHATHVAGSMLLPDGSSGTIDWIDDWSQGTPRYRRQSNQGSATHVSAHDGSPFFTIHQGIKALHVREFDKTVALLAHMPGAALSEILSNPNYGVKLGHSSDDPSLAEIDVISANRGWPKSKSEEKWFISKQSGLPAYVSFNTHDALGSSQEIWQTVLFSHYKTQGNLTVPDQIAEVFPNKQQIRYSLTSFEINPQTIPSDFTGGNQ
jgi:hypothetical protein